MMTGTTTTANPPAGAAHDSPAARVAAPSSSIQREPVMSMPTGLLLTLMIVATLVVAGVWSAAAAIGPWKGDSAVFVSGIVGIAATAVMAFVGLLIMCPWKSRPMGDWMTMWLAATVFRLLGTPVVLFLLYSAASSGSMALAVKPLVLSVALTYLVMVLSEAGIIAWHVRRLLPSP